MEKDTVVNQPAKKKPKTEKPIEEVDIYQKVIDFEAKESADSTTEHDAEAYFNACNEIRSLMAVIHESKQSEDVDTAKVRAACTEACSNVMILKKINRLIKFRLHSQREDLASEKQKLDSTNLQLQNLFYELAHVTSEWNKCRQYKSKDEGIELVPIKEFLKSAQGEVTKPFLNLTDDELKADHSLHLARLEHELQQRVELSELCAKLEQRKVALAADIVRKREQLDAMGPQLDAIIEASKPLQETLGLPIEKTRAECKLAGLLSDGLYMLYGSGRSYNTVYETGIELEIIGDPDLAKQYTEKLQHFNASNQQQSSANPHLDTFDSDSDQDQDSQQPIAQQSAPTNNLNNPNSQSSPLSSSNNESSIMSTSNEDNSAQSRATSSGNKRNRHHHGNRKGREKLVNGDAKKEMLEAHPLSVLMTVNGTKGATSNLPLVKISFTYRPNLHLITVNCTVIPPSTITGQSALHVLHGDQLLNELVGLDDNGTTSPNPNTHFQLSRVGLGSFKSLVCDVGYAYVWAQHMCGLEFPQTKKCNSDLCVSSVETVINALKHRIKMRTKLAEQLNHLGNNRLPPLPEKLQTPKNTISSINKFTGITFQTFCLENDQALALLEAEIINQNSLYYKVNVTRPKTSTSLQAHVVIDHNYPKKQPIFLIKVQKTGSDFLTSYNNEDIRDLERAVNIECFEDLPSDLNVQILAVQIYYLCAYFDVYLETEKANKLEKNSIYFKIVGGRNRRKPFKFRKIGSGIFTQ